jgi:acyl-CoA reductase-like NAD-dependent aldehyde dehydrogenase
MNNPTDFIKQYSFKLLIDGQLEDGAQLMGVINPATGQKLVDSPSANKDQLNRAVQAAKSSFQTWKKTSYEERRLLLSKYADAVELRLEELASVLTAEQGKPLGAAKAEITRALHIMRHLIQIEIKPEPMTNDGAGRAELHYKPVGVVGAITPWNVPIVLGLPKIASALYAGNTIVLKPSPFTPLTTLILGEIANEILPKGSVNIVNGEIDLGQWMTEHPDIDMINFTGSIATGKRVMASSTQNMKRVTLELGGNDPAIVMSDVDPKKVAPKLFFAAFANAGQVCQAIKRLYVHEDIYEELVIELTNLAKNVVMGDGFDSKVTMGPIQNLAQFNRVKEILEDTSKLNGVRVTCGGHALDRQGYFIAPTIVADIKEGTRLVDEETFGPVLPIIKFQDVQDAVKRANATHFGLGGSVWTNDLQQGNEIASQLETGVAWVNFHLGTSPDHPFGGVKESGMGRTNGLMGLLRQMEPQLVVIQNL